VAASGGAAEAGAASAEAQWMRSWIGWANAGSPMVLVSGLAPRGWVHRRRAGGPPSSSPWPPRSPPPAPKSLPRDATGALASWVDEESESGDNMAVWLNGTSG